MGGHNPSIEIEKYDWSKTNVAMFVDIIYEKVKHNKLQTSTFTNTVWEEINKKLYQVTNKNYGVERLKGKWNRLRTRQRLFAALLAHTGVTMDPDTNKVNAPGEVWAEFYLKNEKEYKSIRKEGCDHFHILSEIFGGTTATGDMHRAFTQLPPTSDEERELEEAFINRGVSSYVEVVDDENEDVGGEPNNRRRRKSIARQKYLDLRAAKLEHEQEISSSTGTSGFSDPYSIDMCMQVLNQMDDLSNQVYTKATEAFGKPWLREVFMKIPSNRRAGWLDCLNLDRVTLKEMNLLQDGKKVTVEEGVAMFLLIIGHNTRHRICANRFQHSLYTCSKWFKRVLRAVCTLGTHIIRPYEHNGVHPRILHNLKWFSYFKNCLGAIDGTHVSAWAPTSIQTSFRGRKVIVTQNVMLVCDFDMLSTVVYTGWEETANDSRIQRNLQLRIEEQGKYLQVMFKQQCKSTMNKFNTLSTTEEPSSVSSDPIDMAAKTDTKKFQANNYQKEDARA
ncbi:hypothetical protein ZIOFF_076065 [Zingiber officinale]|uniref:Myb/SANT-like domain-containing protein n=1 Tax=Zingiber officinale TaxID=94328 RepID=A0A8J5C433_ZINOF|nr:hypothetical protein ZIOFF_076065 [Zingiber officinale]